MEEIWKDIVGYEGLYQVSDLGRIKSLERFRKTKKNGYFQKEKILKPVQKKGGYLKITLSKNGKVKEYLIHRIVGQTFIPNPNKLTQINHRNEIKTDNRVNNLEWCTPTYNMKYSHAKKINQYDLNGNFMQTWECIKEIERKLKISDSHIIKCCKRIRKTAGGYIWRYANDRNSERIN